MVHTSDSAEWSVEGSIAGCLALFAARREETLSTRTVSLGRRRSVHTSLSVHRFICAQILQRVVSRGCHTLQAQLQRSMDNFQNGDLFDLMEN